MDFVAISFRHFWRLNLLSSLNMALDLRFYLNSIFFCRQPIMVTCFISCVTNFVHNMHVMLDLCKICATFLFYVTYNCSLLQLRAESQYSLCPLQCFCWTGVVLWSRWCQPQGIPQVLQEVFMWGTWTCREDDEVPELAWWPPCSTADWCMSDSELWWVDWLVHTSNLCVLFYCLLMSICDG